MAAPKGNQFAKGRGSSTVISDALKVAMTDKGRARKLAEKLTEMALEGNLQAAQIVLERLEGKAIQQINQEVTTNAMVVRAPDLARNSVEWSAMYAPEDGEKSDSKPN